MRYDLLDESGLTHRFPRASRYEPEWILKHGMGSNPLWMAEWLCERLDLKPGMRVLDLGCGYAASSIFLAREFDVQVWATDLWVPASENWQRIQDAKLTDKIFPMHAEARSLPYAAEFFDAIVAVDCYPYFGTDDLYLNYLVQFVKPGGQIGIVGAGLIEEMPTPVPEYLREFWTQDLWALHSVGWWRRHWERTGLVEIQNADTMSDGWKLWSAWHHRAAPYNKTEIQAVEEDAGRHLAYIRLVARRMPGVKLEEYAWPDALKSMLKGIPPAGEQVTGESPDRARRD
jgi:cyclopropane fatty-acyl-phospholipid synthase-like methyltransferase